MSDAMVVQHAADKQRVKFPHQRGGDREYPRGYDCTQTVSFGISRSKVNEVIVYVDGARNRSDTTAIQGSPAQIRELAAALLRVADQVEGL